MLDLALIGLVSQAARISDTQIRDRYWPVVLDLILSTERPETIAAATMWLIDSSLKETDQKKKNWSISSAAGLIKTAYSHYPENLTIIRTYAKFCDPRELETLRILKTITDQEEANSDDFYTLSLSLSNFRRTEEATQVLMKGVKKFPDDYKFLVYASFRLFEINAMSESAKVFRKVEHIHTSREYEEDPIFEAYFSCALWLANEKSESMKYYEKFRVLEDKFSVTKGRDETIYKNEVIRKTLDLIRDAYEETK